ncbi:type II toxin-antitoxin system HicB family antitoxin [bacterium]|nr:type II toxin-antitoxin system HicB family antitoxin [bacterium]
MANYIALIHKDSDSDYGVSFPDFPGCITAGKTIDEAKDMAQEALSGHIKVMDEFGDKIPEPSNLEKIMDSYNDEKYVAFFIVSIPDKKSKKVRVNITVPEEDLNQIDSFAKQNGMTRSAFLIKAAQDTIHTSSHS